MELDSCVRTPNVLRGLMHLTGEGCGSEDLGMLDDFSRVPVEVFI